MSASKPTKPFVDIDRMGTDTRLAMAEGPVNVFISFRDLYLQCLIFNTRDIQNNVTAISSGITQIS